jgi:hypothetical protein
MAFAKREGRAELQDTLLALPPIQNSKFKIAAGVPIQKANVTSKMETKT